VLKYRPAGLQPALHCAEAAAAESRRVEIELNTGLTVSFRACDAQGLEAATPRQLGRIDISPWGLGLHFPLLDADLYLPTLLEGFLGTRRWAAARMGHRGGSAKSVAKAAAPRRNGRLGGRPRKQANG
jgi:hypothetical protein